MALACTDVFIHNIPMDCNKLYAHCTGCGGNEAVICHSHKQCCQCPCRNSCRLLNADQAVAALPIMRLAKAKNLLYVHACTVVDLTQVGFLKEAMFGVQINGASSRIAFDRF